MFLTLEDALEHIIDLNKYCNRNGKYMEEELIIGTKTILVSINIWELPEDNLES